MAKSVGQGQLIFTGYVAGAHNLSFADEIDVHDATTYVDYPYETHETGHKRCDITATLFHDTQNTARTGDRGLLICKIATGQAIYGTASLIRAAPGIPVKGLSTMDYGFKFQGTFQYSG